MASWLFVVGEQRALEWIVAEKRMAFRPHIKADALGKGDGFALYVTRGAFHNPGRDETQVLATGVVTSDVIPEPVVVADEEFGRSVRLRFDGRPLPAHHGVPFRALVPELTFIRKKPAWFAYVRKSLVPIPDDDLATIATAVNARRSGR